MIMSLLPQLFAIAIPLFHGQYRMNGRALPRWHHGRQRAALMQHMCRRAETNIRALPSTLIGRHVSPRRAPSTLALPAFPALLVVLVLSALLFLALLVVALLAAATHTPHCTTPPCPLRFRRTNVAWQRRAEVSVAMTGGMRRQQRRHSCE